MNVLFWILLAALLILTVVFLYALRNGYGGTSIVCFVLAVLLAGAGIVATFMPPKAETYLITKATSKQVLTLFDETSGKSMSLNLKSVNHINAEFKKDEKIQIWRNMAGDIIYVAPEKWTVIGK